MSYFDNVDWDELSKQAMDKALRKTFELRIDGKITGEDMGTVAKAFYERYWDEIWLMGPVPMKQGYEPPIFNFGL